MLAGIPDKDFTDNLTFWTSLTSGQPITGSAANKHGMKCTWAWSRQTYSLTARLTWTMHGCWQHSINILSIGCTRCRCPAAASFSTTKQSESRLLCALVPLCVSLMTTNVDKQLTLSGCIASRAWRIQASIRDTAFWTTLCGGQWPERRYSLSRNPCVLITTVKDQTGFPWYHGRGVNVWLGMSQLQTLMPDHIHCTDKGSSRCSSGTGRREQNNYNYLLSNYIFIPLACEISGVWCVEGIDFLNELGRRTSLDIRVIRMKHIISSKDCLLLYREIMQLAFVVVSLLLTSAMINTPPSATPNYIHPQCLMPPGT